MSYKERLETIQGELPFDYWMAADTEADDDDEDGIFWVLIDRLIALGEDGKAEDKLAAFQKLVLELNELSAEDEGLIETAEREDLCELIDEIAVAAGFDVSTFGEGGSFADQWREW